MATDDGTVLDWVHLPAGIQELSLWSCLHDGTVVRIASDALNRTAELTFAVGYIAEHHALRAMAGTAPRHARDGAR